MRRAEEYVGNGPNKQCRSCCTSPKGDGADGLDFGLVGGVCPGTGCPEPGVVRSSPRGKFRSVSRRVGGVVHRGCHGDHRVHREDVVGGTGWRAGSVGGVRPGLVGSTPVPPHVEARDAVIRPCNASIVHDGWTIITN